MSTHPAFEAALANNDQAQLRLLYEVAIHQRNLAEDRVRCLLNTVSICSTTVLQRNTEGYQPSGIQPSPPSGGSNTKKPALKTKPASTEIEF